MWTLFYSLLFVATYAFNGYIVRVVFVGCKHRQLSRIHAFTFHLCLAGMLEATFSVLPRAFRRVIELKAGDVVYVTALEELAASVAVYILTGMAVERTISLKSAYGQWRLGTASSIRARLGYTRVANLLVLAAWLFAIALSACRFLLVNNKVRRCCCCFCCFRH